MEGLQVTPAVRSTPHRVLRFVVLAICILIFGTWAQVHFTSLQVKHAQTSEPDLAAAKEKAQPLVDALEQYRAENGLYPVALDQVSPRHASSMGGSNSYRYSARQNDWVFKSDECVEREKPLHGLILKESKEYYKEVTQFKSECVAGYRYYQLQTPNFAPDPQLHYMERWAYYDSSNRQWSVGWCSHSRSRGPALATDGVCRWNQHGAPDPW